MCHAPGVNKGSYKDGEGCYAQCSGAGTSPHSLLTLALFVCPSSYRTTTNLGISTYSGGQSPGYINLI